MCLGTCLHSSSFTAIVPPPVTGALGVIGASGRAISHLIWIGSSNYTRPGLLENVELNLLTADPTQVAYLREWFERLWRDTEAMSPELIKVIEHHCEKVLSLNH